MKRVWHRVFHKSWWVLGWHSQFKDGPHLTWSLCLSDFNRPIVRWAFEGPDGCNYVDLSWGNGNSDPAWSIGFQW